MPRLKKMMQVLILLILPFMAVGGTFEVCREAEHHAHCHSGISECCLREEVGDCCAVPGTHCRHGHHHELIRLLLDAGLLEENDFSPSEVSGCCAGRDVADIGPCSHGRKAMPTHHARRLLLSACCLLIPLRC